MKKIISVLLLGGVSVSAAATIQINNTLASTDTANIHYTTATALAVPLKTATVDAAGAAGSNVGILTTSSVYRVGFFSGLDATKIATLSNETTTLSTALSMFTPLGVGALSATSTLNLGTDNTANFKTTTSTSAASERIDRIVTSFGSVTYSADAANTASVDSGIGRGTRLFILMTDSTASISGEDGSSEKWALVSATDWLIPATGTANTVLALKNVDTPGEVFHGRLGSIELVNSVVPEPSISALFLLGAAVGFRRRR